MKLAHRGDPSLIDAGSRYRPLRLLGEGSFGAVYEAEGLLGQRVALKALTRKKPEALAQFKREFRSLSQISHVNLVDLRELYEHQGTWFIAMEFVPGTDLLSWIRTPFASDGTGFDEARLRGAFAGISNGLSALHGKGLLHRDLKPSNVRVTPEGRAVLLDFGLVTGSSREAQSSHGSGAGTVEYMAPEQVTGDMLGPAADWYAFGTCLYEALTGRLPFEGETSFAVALRKTREDPLPPRYHVATVPGDLDAMCTALLRCSPDDRMTGKAVQAAFAVPERRPSPQSVAPSDNAFEGRSAELERLAGALSQTHEGACSLVLVEGESGIGKSTLLREFVARECRREPSTLVLEGRCYEHERVPYKAFDGCTEALAKALGALPSEVCAALMPRRAGLLAELFPVLRSVRALGGVPPRGAPAELSARRLEGFQAFAELLGKLAETRPLILMIDDLQWADQESFRLLRALIEGQAPSLLLACTVRPLEELSAEVRPWVDELRKRPGARVLEVHGLGTAHAAAYARRLLGPDASRDAITQITHESRGHPMLIAELAHYAARPDSAADRTLTLDRALSARIAALSPAARLLLEVVALSGKPHPERMFANIVERQIPFGDALKELLAAHLLRRNGEFELMPAHDRVRNAAVAGIAEARLPELHKAIARQLGATTKAEPSELAFHWERAGNRERALELYVRAAASALETMAFARAGDLYGRALELHGTVDSWRGAELLIQRAHALVALGRSADAAELYGQAAEWAEEEERVRLRVWAAQHQIQSAQYDAGVESARAVLSDLGVVLPRGSARAMASVVWERMRLSFRGFDVAQASAEKSRETPREKLVLDAMEALMFPVSWIELLPSNALNMLHLRRALDLGEPGHVARALSSEAAFSAMLGRFERCPQLLDRAFTQAAASGPATQAYVRLMRGSVATFQGQCAGALGDYEAAEELLVASCPSEGWLLTNVRMSLGIAYYHTGMHERLAESMDRWFAEAESRRDGFATTALLGMGLGAVSILMRDAPEECTDRLDASMESWRGRRPGFAHHGEVTARGLIGTYQGGPALREWLREHKREHDGAFMYRSGFMRDVLLAFRAIAALSTHCTGNGHEDTLLREAEHFAGKLSGARSLWGAPYRELIHAQVLALRGQLEGAKRGALLAQAAYQELGARGFVQSIAYFIGVLERDAGHERRETALTFFREAGWQKPWLAATTWVPAARFFEGDAPPSSGK